jgi:excinuclease UvrABC nuclease subunit
VDRDPEVPLHEQEAWRVPVGPGIYLIYDRERLVYIGKTTCLRARFSRHTRRSHNPQLARKAGEEGITFTYRRVFTARELDETERQLIRELGPAFNRVRYRKGEGARGSRLTSDRPRRA